MKAARRLLISAGLLIPILVLLYPIYRRVEWEAPGIRATRTLKAIRSAEKRYVSIHGRYAKALKELDGLLHTNLMGDEKDGYRFRLEGTADGYQIHADLLTYGKSIPWAMYMDQTGLIRIHHGVGPASASDPEFRYQ